MSIHEKIDEAMAKIEAAIAAHPVKLDVINIFGKDNRHQYNNHNWRDVRPLEVGEVLPLPRPNTVYVDAQEHSIEWVEQITAWFDDNQLTLDCEVYSTRLQDKPNGHYFSMGYRYYFETEEQATLFKLWWSGQ